MRHLKTILDNKRLNPSVEIVSEDLVIGTGPSPTVGRNVVVHYEGWLPDGTLFDSSKRKGKPFQFTFGCGEVIPGWDEGLKSMQVGGTRLLTIPPRLAYGSSGLRGIIPPNCILKFKIELIEIH